MMLDSETTFDPAFAAPVEWAEMYRRAGVQVVPAPSPMRTRGDKRPALADWRQFQTDLASDAVFERWFPASARPNMGMITGAASGNIVCIDLDDYNGPEAGAWWADVTLGIEPETWKQRTGGGGRQIFFRLPEGVTIGNCRTAIGVDIRGQGGFAMLPPSLHMSGDTYRWAEGCGPWEIEIDTATPRLVEAIKALIEEHGGGQSSPAAQRTASPGNERDPFGATIDGREEKMRNLIWARLITLWRECPILDPRGMETEMARAWADYERTTKTRLQGVANADGLEREGRGLTAIRDHWTRALRKWDHEIAEEGRKEPVAPKPAASEPFLTATPPRASTAANGIKATPFEYIDPSSIPPRAWIYDRHYIRKFVSTTVAPGGVGKTALKVVEALCIASGDPLLGVAPTERANVWFWNGEDPREEMDRRIMAAVLHYGLAPEKIVGRLFVDTGRETPIIIAEKTRDGAIINAPVIEQVVATIKANGIGVVIIDPFVSCHRVTENDNGEIERVAKAWAHIADATNCAVELVHHVRKTNGNEVTVEDGRGAVALLAAARAARAINRMSADEAARAGVTEPGLYFRADNGKANLAPPSSNAAWFHLASVDLGNDTPANANAPARPSDKVGVVTRWQWPDPTADITASDLMETRRIVAAGNWRADPRSEQWVGYAILQALGFDDALNASEAAKGKAKALQKMWTESRALEEFDAPDERRKMRKFVRPGPFNDG